ncbi:hypothetical protein LZ32DRAFT_195937 [Colletotrichum eremochloae]|nr:hypothetical protein LZ32DRAFT_195937 [Colletotrichum eremochloae]
MSPLVFPLCVAKSLQPPSQSRFGCVQTLVQIRFLCILQPSLFIPPASGCRLSNPIQPARDSTREHISGVPAFEARYGAGVRLVDLVGSLFFIHSLTLSLGDALYRDFGLLPPSVGMATALKTPESWMGWIPAKNRDRLLDGYRHSAACHRYGKSPQGLKLFASRVLYPGSSVIPIETHRVLISTMQSPISISSAAVR